MKQKLAKLFMLFIVMSVLTSSSKDSGTGKCDQSANCPYACPAAKNDDANTVSCNQASMGTEKNNDDCVAALADNEISLSPISRFILVQ